MTDKRHFLNGVSKTSLVAAMVVLWAMNSSVFAAAPCLPGLPCEFVTPPSAPPSSGPNAPKAIETKTPTGNNSCDADFMNQIYARAFLESERENIINEVIVRKPDSVLEYTCFDQFLSYTAGPGAEIFTESDRWHNIRVPIGGNIGGVPVPDVAFDVYMGNDKVDKSLNFLVMDSLNKYIDKNFYHDFLGGVATGINSSISATVGSVPSYLCDAMYTVHHLAKCNDFGLDDPFMTFSEFVGAANDPRALPQQCIGTAITDDLIKLAHNENWNYAAAEAVTTHNNLMNIAPKPTCEAPIPTGLIVRSETVTLDIHSNPTVSGSYQFQDKVCPNPGCTFNNQNDANPLNDRCDP